jgi:predicted transcriptional regulator
VNIKETLKKFRVRDILPRDFISLPSDTTLARVLEHIFHSHQEDFPIVDDGRLVGFITRQDIMASVHRFGLNKAVKEMMHSEFPKVRESDSLIKAQNIMQENSFRALPVVQDSSVVGVITFEDIGRVYSMLSQKI